MVAAPVGRLVRNGRRPRRGPRAVYGLRGRPWDRTCDLGVLLLHVRRLRPDRPGARTWAPSPRRTVVITAQVTIAAAVVAATAAFVLLDKSVTVSVDGQTSHLHTFSGSVRAILAHDHVTLGPHDTVSPALDRSVGSGGTVLVRRGRPLHVTFDGVPQRRWVTADTVGGALAQFGDADRGTYVSVPRSTPIGVQGATFAVRLPHAVRILADGVDRQVISTEANVTSLLWVNGLTLGAHDLVSVPAAAYPGGGMTISVTRVSVGRLVASQVVARSVRRVADSSLPVGSTRTVRDGEDGVVTLTYNAVFTNGELSTKVLAAATTTTAMQPTVIAYGTKPVPIASAAPIRAAATATAGSGVATAGSGGLDWAGLASCESGGNTRSVSSSGAYRGLYQFTSGTWQAVGGSGDPIDASAAEQTHRAQLLYAARGRGAWPACGRYL